MFRLTFHSKACPAPRRRHAGCRSGGFQETTDLFPGEQARPATFVVTGFRRAD